jgi:microcin C transport system ATP-binding protein
MIAMALACRPKLLLADEPTTALDVTIRAQILDLLRDLQAEFGMAVMLITHDLNMVRAFAQRVGVMEKGVLVETGETTEVFPIRTIPTRKLIDSRPRREVLPLVPLAPVLLETDALCVNYMKKRPGMAGWFLKEAFPAVKEVNLQLREGETVGIVGSRAQARRRWLTPCSRSSARVAARSSSWAAASIPARARSAARCARGCRWYSRTRSGRCLPG